MNRNSEHRKNRSPSGRQDAKRTPAPRFHNRPELIQTSEGVTTGGRRRVAATRQLLKVENLPFFVLFFLAAASLLSRLWLILQ